MQDVYLDTSNSGAGYVFDTDRSYTNWSKDAVGSSHINDHEIYAAVLTDGCWVPLWANFHVLFHADNITACAFLCKGCAESPAIMPHLWSYSDCFIEFS